MDIEGMLTDEDVREMELCMLAEANGDARRALVHYFAGLHLEGAPHPHHLHEIVDLGDHAPGWVWSRWVIGQAYRWMLVEEDPRVTDAVIQAFVVGYPGVDFARPFGMETREFGTRLAASDWICEQLATFEYGGLVDFLDVKAGAFLERRADRIRDWAAAPMGGYRLEGVRGDCIQLTDLATGDELEALNIGALAERDDGTCVIGRPVPIEAAPGQMFASRPLAVPEETAREAGLRVFKEAPNAWLCALGEARIDGTLPLHFAFGQGTPLSTDLLPENWDGGPGMDVESAVGACEMALMGARLNPITVQRTAAHVSAALMDSRVFAAVQSRCAAPEDAGLWRLLAESTPEPVRGRCLEMARLCRAAA